MPHLTGPSTCYPTCCAGTTRERNYEAHGHTGPGSVHVTRAQRCTRTASSRAQLTDAAESRGRPPPPAGSPEHHTIPATACASRCVRSMLCWPPTAVVCSVLRYSTDLVMVTGEPRRTTVRTRLVIKLRSPSSASYPYCYSSFLNINGEK